MATEPEIDIAAELLLAKEMQKEDKELEGDLALLNGRILALRTRSAALVDRLTDANCSSFYYFTYRGPGGPRKNVYPSEAMASRILGGCPSYNVRNALLCEGAVRSFHLGMLNMRTGRNLTSVPFDPQDFVAARDAQFREMVDGEFSLACGKAVEILAQQPFVLFIKSTFPVSFHWAGTFATRDECDRTIATIRQRIRHAIPGSKRPISYEVTPYKDQGCPLVWPELVEQETEAIIAKMLAELGRVFRLVPAETNKDRDRS